MQLTDIIKTISLIGACALAVTTVRAVDPPPDGGYANGNTAEGQDALLNLSVGGIQNTALGFEALLNETSGDNNTATGYQALRGNTTGSANTATGVWALTANTTGSANTATGIWALFSNTTGENNTATGLQALYSNTSGMYNTGTGSAALFENTTGNNNTATGFGSLVDNTIGNNNSAVGRGALAVNTTGGNNTAQGYFTLVGNTTGSNNTANGVSALQGNTTGSGNIALGFNAGINLTTGNDNIDIGNAGLAGESNKIRIGSKGTHKATSIAGISGVTVANGVGVIINTQGQLGTVVSSERFKDGIRPMGKSSLAILALQPVTFRYKHELDPDGIPQFGLVAEQVEKVNPDLVARDEAGKPYTVRYEAVNAMLLNEFLREHLLVEDQALKVKSLEKAIAEQETENKTMRAMLREQAAQIQKVSDQLKTQVFAPRVVANN